MDARAGILALLDARSPGLTICPSEVARTMFDGSQPDRGTEDWRDAMPAVHAAIDQLVSEGSVVLSWKGVVLDRREGPYRIRGVNSDDATKPCDG